MDMPAAPQYFRLEYAPHVELFHCKPLHASLTAEACARRHAQQEDYPCADCQTGALHAARLGIKVIRDKARAAHTRPCCRCGRHELRLIGARLCVSCLNREREWIRGRNAKGNPPTIKLQWYEALMVVRGGLGTRALSGVGVQRLGNDEYSLTLAALDKAEVQRVIAAIWPLGEIVELAAIRQPAQPNGRSAPQFCQTH